MSQDTVFALPAELNLYTATALREDLLAWSAFAGNEAWTLDATAVDSVDAAGVQLLLALSCSARAHGATLALMDAPRCLVQAIARLGAATALAPTLTERVTTEAGSA